LCPKSEPVVPAPIGLTGSVCRELLSLFGDEPGAPELFQPVVEQQRQVAEARRQVDPWAVIIESIWAAAHRQEAIATSEVQQRVNALLRGRGENLEFSANEIGWKMSDLGLRRKRNAKGMFLKFTQPVRAQIHGLAEKFRLPVPKMEGCRECAPVQMIEQ
jgi:hypothetical protein